MGTKKKRHFSSVYRLQWHENFSFSKVIAILPYFKELGIEGVYFSPYFCSYSMHGYDIIDATKINDRLGGEEGFRELCYALRNHGLAHVIDVIPNHMGIQGKNLWWQDVLQKGVTSQYASFFDINWQPEKKELANKILLPILEADYGTVLSQFAIQLHRDKNKGYYFSYQAHRLPVASESIPRESEVEKINQSEERLHELLEKQHYRLAYWSVASHEINYRRFFNLSEFAAMHIEDPEVLEAHHKLLFMLMEEGVIDALRIDHPDGLYDPAAYFKELKKRADLPLIVEKILGSGEKLPLSWSVEGSVGYEYLNLLNGLFVCRSKAEKMQEIYESFVGKKMNAQEILLRAKKLYTNYYMAHEIESLALFLDQITEDNLHYRDFTRFELTEALQELIAYLPVYRTYIGPLSSPSYADRNYLTEAIDAARKSAKQLDGMLFDFLEKLFLCEIPESNDPRYRDFILRFQQLTGPIFAKGLEDTAFYIYNRLISLNEVGGELGAFGYTVEEFHSQLQEKQRRWPLGFFPSSTHDAKRSEDMRMRIHVLSELSEEWERLIREWGIPKGIDANAVYMIYQQLLGVWSSNQKEPFFFERVWPVIQKCLREAGERSSWRRPDLPYEELVKSFLVEILQQKSVFLSSFQPFQEKINRLGALNSLSAQVLRLGSPAIVDIYQGSETLYYAMVDPDNRRGVDFSALQARLARVRQKRGELLYQQEEFDDLKLWLVSRMLHIRRERGEFFLSARYEPIRIEGDKKDHIVGYVRGEGEEVVVILATRLYAELGEAVGGCWKGMRGFLPKRSAQVLHSIFTDEVLHVGEGSFSIEEALKELPFQCYISK